jgi:hypothetical protein
MSFPYSSLPIVQNSIPLSAFGRPEERFKGINFEDLTQLQQAMFDALKTVAQERIASLTGSMPSFLMRSLFRADSMKIGVGAYIFSSRV